MSDDERLELMKRGWIPPYRDIDDSLIPEADLVVEFNVGFNFLSPPQNIEEQVKRQSCNVQTMRVAEKLKPLIKEMVITALMLERERAGREVK